MTFEFDTYEDYNNRAGTSVRRRFLRVAAGERWHLHVGVPWASLRLGDIELHVGVEWAED